MPKRTASLKDRALTQLQASGGQSSARTDAGVHAIRRQLKQARALLRLMRLDLGDSAYAAENTRCRDAARPLAALRDSGVLLNTAARHPPPRAAKRIRRRLIEEHDAARQRLDARRVRDAEDALRLVRDSVSALPLTDTSKAAQGLRKAYRTGRKSFSAAKRDRSDIKLHEARKQAKYLFNQVRIVDAEGRPALKRLCRRAEKLAEILGEDHDLAMLDARIDALVGVAGRGRQNTARRWRQRITKRRRKLWKRARTLGRKLYRRKAKRVAI